MASTARLQVLITESFPSEMRAPYSEYQSQVPRAPTSRLSEAKRSLILRFLQSPTGLATTAAEREAKHLADTSYAIRGGRLCRFVDATHTKTVRALTAGDVFDVLAESHVALGHAGTGKVYGRTRRAADGIHVGEVSWFTKNCRVCYPPADAAAGEAHAGAASPSAAATTTAVNVAISAGLALGSGRGWTGGASDFCAADRSIRVVLVELGASFPAAAFPAAASGAAGATLSVVAAAAVYVQDPKTRHAELYAPTAPTPLAHAACILRWAASHGRPQAVHVGAAAFASGGIDGRATLQALRDAFGVRCHLRGELPLVLQLPADADVGPIVRSKLRAFAARRPQVGWQDALAAVALALNDEVKGNAPAAPVAGAAAAAAPSSAASASAMRPEASASGAHAAAAAPGLAALASTMRPEASASGALAARGREIITIDSDSDVDSAAAPGNARKRVASRGDAPSDDPAAEPAKRSRLEASEGIFASRHDSLTP